MLKVWEQPCASSGYATMTQYVSSRAIVVISILDDLCAILGQSSPEAFELISKTGKRPDLETVPAEAGTGARTLALMTACSMILRRGAEHVMLLDQSIGLDGTLKPRSDLGDSESPLEVLSKELVGPWARSWEHILT